MATEITIGMKQVKQQNLWALLGLVVITLGIYSLFWYYRVNREMKEAGEALGDAELAATQPVLSLIALFFPIANLVTMHKTGRRVQRVQQAAGGTPDYSMGVHWVLLLFTGLWFLYTQSALNHVWERAGGAASTSGTPSAQPHLTGTMS